MRIKVLGAHNSESRETKNVSLLIDGNIAIDAGGLTSSLSFEEQEGLKAILLSHAHYDHIRDIPALAINLYLRGKCTVVYTHQDVYDKLTANFLNGEVYSKFHKNKNGNQASLDFHIIQGLQSFTIGSYIITAVPVKHSIPSLSYQVVSPDGGSIFYTGDTGPGLSDIWALISPKVLFIEVTAANRWQESSLLHGHLTADLLMAELTVFKKIKGYLPRVITIHMNPLDEPQIRTELLIVERNLGISIEMAFEGMLVDI